MKILFLLFLLAFTAAVPRVGEKIIGGHNCGPKEAQYHVAICRDSCAGTNNIICGGTLIRPNWVLTAAHCDKGKRMKVLNESHDVHKILPENVYEVAKRIPHPQHSQSEVKGYFDVMLLQLSKEIPGRNIREPSNVDCSSFPPSTIIKPPLRYKVAGHGICGYNRTAGKAKMNYPIWPDKLQCVIVEQNKCPKGWNDHPKYHKNMFCAGGNGKATRSGDSGGGLVILDVVYGVVHGGSDPDTIGNMPGIYMNVCEFRDWISSTITKYDGKSAGQAMN